MVVRKFGDLSHSVGPIEIVHSARKRDIIDKDSFDNAIYIGLSVARPQFADIVVLVNQLLLNCTRSSPKYPEPHPSI